MTSEQTSARRHIERQPLAPVAQTMPATQPAPAVTEANTSVPLTLDDILARLDALDSKEEKRGLINSQPESLRNSITAALKQRKDDAERRAREAQDAELDGLL